MLAAALATRPALAFRRVLELKRLRCGATLLARPRRPAASCPLATAVAPLAVGIGGAGWRLAALIQANSDSAAATPGSQTAPPQSTRNPVRRAPLRGRPARCNAAADWRAHASSCAWRACSAGAWRAASAWLAARYACSSPVRATAPAAPAPRTAPAARRAPGSWAPARRAPIPRRPPAAAAAPAGSARLASNHSRSRGQARISASCATSTVGSRLRVPVERQQPVAAERLQHPVQRRRPVAASRGQLRPPHPPPRVLHAFAQRHQPQEELPRHPLLALAQPAVDLLGAPGQRALHPPARPVGRQGQPAAPSAARTARSAHIPAAAACPAARPRPAMIAATSAASSSRPPAPPGCAMARASSSGLRGSTTSVRWRTSSPDRGRAAAGRRSRPAG